MPDRLPIPASRVSDVAKAAHVSVATVLRYRQARGDGSPRHGLHDASVYLIEKAIRELPAAKQLDIPMDKPQSIKYASPRHDSEILGQGTGQMEVNKMRTPPRPRLRLELPKGIQMPAADGRHWYEERETA